MEQNKAISIDEQFNEDCEVVNLRYEYPGYTGTESYGIITRLTEQEFAEKYEALMEQYKPYILLPFGMKKERRRFKRNEDKYYKRSVRGHIFSIDDEFEEHHPELCVVDDEGQEVIHEKLERALASLTREQERRIRLYYFEGFGGDEIAKMENVTNQAVFKSINGGLKKIKNFLVGGLENGLSQSEQVKGLCSEPDRNAFKKTN